MNIIQSPKTIIHNVEIIDIAEQGKTIAKVGDLVFFLTGGVPGDIVDIEVLKRKKNYANAKIKNLVKPSSFRTQAFCKHFGVCGGCTWQHMTYAAQLYFKQKSITDALFRIAGIDSTFCESILPSPQVSFYRNKLEFTFSNKAWVTTKDEVIANNTNALGFHVPLRFDKVLNIETCHLQAEPSNYIRNGVRDYALSRGYTFYHIKEHQGCLRNLIIRNTTIGELMVLVVFAYPTQEQIESLMLFIKESFPTITSLLYTINQKKNDTLYDQCIHTYAGRDHIFEEIPKDGRRLKFKVSAKSFYQTNPLQAHELYKHIEKFAELKGNELVYDLYTGAGTIANFLAGSVQKVVGVDYIPSAIEDAKANSIINGIENTTFFAGDIKEVLNNHFCLEHGKPDLIIVDPPRAGMHPLVVQRLVELEAPKLIYVSCNAATQARDIAQLKHSYRLARIQPIDMFPHTQHVENIVLLSKN